MTKPHRRKKPNPVARKLAEFKPKVVPGKTRYKRKPKHPKKGEEEEA